MHTFNHHHYKISEKTTVTGVAKKTNSVAISPPNHLVLTFPPDKTYSAGSVSAET